MPILHMNILVDLRVQTLALVHLRGSLQLRSLSAPLAINIGAQICAPEVHRCPFVHYARFGSRVHSDQSAYPKCPYRGEIL
jgi:hypothetical protein